MKLRKTVRDLSVHERTDDERGPKTSDCRLSRYCVCRGEVVLEDFGKYAKAVKWARDNFRPQHEDVPNPINGQTLQGVH